MGPPKSLFLWLVRQPSSVYSTCGCRCGSCLAAVLPPSRGRSQATSLTCRRSPLPTSSEYARNMGLLQGGGWDGFHPRWVLQLPESHQYRLLYILMLFEVEPAAIMLFLTNVVFLDKPTGGVRPIGLMRFFMKTRSRMKQPICRRWDTSHVFDFFWGSGPGTSCERAG